MTENQQTTEDLKIMQNWSLERKIQVTQTRILEWYLKYDGQVYVAFSGGKDSTILLDLARKMYPEIKAVFIDTGLEYPEIRDFVKTKENITWQKSEMKFNEVVKEYGWNFPSKDTASAIYYAKRGSVWAVNKFKGQNKDGTFSEYKQMYKKYAYLLDAPFKISNKCCEIMKENPLRKFEKENKLKPITAIMASESKRRKDSWLKTGCNAFDSKFPISKPMSFWTEQDVLTYLKEFNIPYCSVYGEIVEDKKGKLITTGCERTGCMFCPVGCHLHHPNKFQMMKETHPKMYNYCINGGEFDENGMWIPNQVGLGLGKVLDYINVKY